MASTDRVFRKFHEYMSARENEIKSEEDFNRISQEFMVAYNQSIREGKELGPETSDDYLELAENATSRKKCIEYATKAVELDNDNLDAARIIIDETSKTPMEALGKYEALVAKGTKIMEKEGYFKNATGEFWLAFETRPYMRAMYWCMRTLVDCGMMRRAAAECEDMLRLCRNDNLGVRYELMHIYAFLEDKAAADKLYKKYNGEETTHFLLPYSILYFRAGELEKASKILKQLAAENKDTKKFFRAINAKSSSYLDKAFADLSPHGERYNTIDEFLGEIEGFGYLTDTSIAYFEWGNEELKKK